MSRRNGDLKNSFMAVCDGGGAINPKQVAEVLARTPVEQWDKQRIASFGPKTLMKVVESMERLEKGEIRQAERALETIEKGMERGDSSRMARGLRDAQENNVGDIAAKLMKSEISPDAAQQAAGAKIKTDFDSKERALLGIMQTADLDVTCKPGTGIRAP